jgi:hypothetical protein
MPLPPTHSVFSSADAGPSTPRKQGTGSFSGPSSTPHSRTSDNATKDQQLTQDGLKNVMEVEMDGATWECKDVMTRLCPSDQGVLKRVLTALKKEGTWYAKSGFLTASPVRNAAGKFVSTTVPAGERGHYQPFVDIFLAVRKSFQAASNNAAGFHLNHVMFVYDRPIADSVGGAAKLKPDVVLAAARDTSLFWRDILIPVEVKNDWRELLKQALTYIRAVFAKQDRYYVPCILYNFTQKAVRFCFGTRSGVISSPMFRLTTNQGFTAFVGGLVGILSLKDEAAAGIQPSQDVVDWLREKTGADYVKAERMMIRAAVRGRGTAVDLYERETAGTAERIPEEADDPEEEYTMEQMFLPVTVSPSKRMTRSATAAARLKLDQAKPSVPSALNVTPTSPASSSKLVGPLPDETTKVGMLRYQNRSMTDVQPSSVTQDIVETTAHLSIEDFPHRIVVKTSWPRNGDVREAALFEDLKKKGPLFGLPAVLDVQASVPSAQPLLDFLDAKNDHFIPWPAFGTAYPGSKPEQRTFIRVAFGTLGKPLETAEGPRQLVESVLHAIIGM